MNSSPLRVLHLNSMLTGGGIDDRSVRVAHALKQQGHDIWIAGPQGREFSKVAHELDVPFHAIRPNDPLKLPMIFSVARFIRSRRIQIVHARHGRDYWPAILAAHWSGVRPKIVINRHLAKSPGSWVSRRFLLSQCDAIVAVSQFVAKVLREGHSDSGSDNPERHYRRPMSGNFSKLHVIYGGFDMDRFKPLDGSAQRLAWELPPHHYTFAVVGRYDLPRGKGQREFLQAAARVHAELSDARFLLIGRGSMKEILEQDIARLGLSGVARMIPYTHQIPEAMNALDCLVVPQVATEAIPGVVIEAHACGKPVIASDLDGIPEAFAAANFGQLVTRGDVSELAAAMKTWASKPPLDMAARWKLHERVAERFSLDCAEQNLAALYQALLNQER